MNSDNAILQELMRVNTLAQMLQSSTSRAISLLSNRMSDADLSEGYGVSPAAAMASMKAAVADLKGRIEPPAALEEKAAAKPAAKPAAAPEPKSDPNPFAEKQTSNEGTPRYSLADRIAEWDGLAARTGTNLRKFYGKEVNIGTVCANWTDDRPRIEGIGKASRSDLEDLIDQTTAHFGDETVAAYAIAPPGTEGEDGDDDDELPQIIQDAMAEAGEDSPPTTVAAFRTIMMKATSLTPEWSEATTPAFEELGINGPAAIEDTPEAVGRAFRVLSRHFGVLEYEG